MWWPRGYGEPSLYDASVKVYVGAELLDDASVKVGIRSIKLIQEPDDEGKHSSSKSTAKTCSVKAQTGYPPTPSSPKSTTNSTTNSSAPQPTPTLTCSASGAEASTKQTNSTTYATHWASWFGRTSCTSAQATPKKNGFCVRRSGKPWRRFCGFGGTPRIVVWCGNNENQWLHNVLWKTRDKVERLYGSEIYESLLARICQSLDPTRPYRPSSPFGGDDASGRHEGDRHNWEVWSQGIDYPAYLDDNGRFISEFGWQAPPTMELLKAYLEKEDLTPSSNAFRAHEKQTGGLELLRALLAVHYPVPEDLRLFVLYSQLNQGEALKTAVTHWRSRMFKTSGCLIWQLNDCWPVISWSLIDYGINPKAAYYYVKRAYQPVIAPIIVKQGKVEAFIINETDKPLEATLKFEVLTFGGEVLYDQTAKTSVPPYTSQLALQKALEALPIKDNAILVTTLECQGKVLYEDARTVVEPKDLKLPTSKIQAATKKVDEKTFEITLQTQVYAKAVKIEIGDLRAKFSDNFFDLLPNRQKVVVCQLERDMSAEQFDKTMSYQSYPYT